MSTHEKKDEKTDSAALLPVDPSASVQTETLPNAGDNEMRYVAYCQEGPIGEGYVRHSICCVNPSDDSHHACFVDVIAHTEEEAAEKARIIADALNFVRR